MMEYKISVSDVLTAFDKFLDDIGSKVTAKEKISCTDFRCFEVSLAADILVWKTPRWLCQAMIRARVGM